MKNIHWTKEDYVPDNHPGLYNEIEQKKFLHTLRFASKKHEITAKIAGHWCNKNSLEGCGIDPSPVFNPQETEKEKPYGYDFLDGFFNFGPIGLTASWANWALEAVMKASYCFAVIYFFVRWILNKLRERDDRRARNALKLVIENGLKTPAVDQL